jgi:hypothetical protein
MIESKTIKNSNMLIATAQTRIESKAVYSLSLCVLI